MKQALRNTLLMLLPLLLAACDKMPMNGHLDGLWQLMEIETPDETRQLKDERLYCSFQLHLFMLGDLEDPRHYFGYFEHKGDNLRFYSFTFRSQYTEESNIDELMTDERDLGVIAPWGFYSTDCTFRVVRLDASQLVLEHDGTTIRYRKF